MSKIKKSAASPLAIELYLDFIDAERRQWLALFAKYGLVEP